MEIPGRNTKPSLILRIFIFLKELTGGEQQMLLSAVQDGLNAEYFDGWDPIVAQKCLDMKVSIIDKMGEDNVLKFQLQDGVSDFQIVKHEDQEYERASRS